LAVQDRRNTHLIDVQFLQVSRIITSRALFIMQMDIGWISVIPGDG
jgi:hypothetical protein